MFVIWADLAVSMELCEDSDSVQQVLQVSSLDGKPFQSSGNQEGEKGIKNEIVNEMELSCFHHRDRYLILRMSGSLSCHLYFASNKYGY